jgi:hypothetical protein
MFGIQFTNRYEAEREIHMESCCGDVSQVGSANMRYDASNIREIEPLSATTTHEMRRQRRYRAQRVQGLHAQRKVKELHSLVNVLCGLLHLFVGRVPICEPIKLLKFRCLFLGTPFPGTRGGATWGCSIEAIIDSIRSIFGRFGTATISAGLVRTSLFGGESG